MANWFGERRKTKIRICLACNFVGEFNGEIDCPNCGTPHRIGFWEKPENFQTFVRVNKPANLIIRDEDEHLKFIVEEALAE